MSLIVQTYVELTPLFGGGPTGPFGGVYFRNHLPVAQLGAIHAR